jgi:hypothetical protein
MKALETSRTRMNRRTRTALGFLLAALPLLTAGTPQSGDSPYGVGDWDPETGVGNHRAVVRVEMPAAPKAVRAAGKPAAVRVTIPWRRRDVEPEKKNVIVVDAATGERILNVLPVVVSRESGEFVFEPKTVPGEYYFYYMPYKSEGRKNYPNVKYDPPQVTADPAWLAANRIAASGPDAARSNTFPAAEFVRIQSVDDFSMFTMMEEIATAPEIKALLDRNPDAAYLLFPEDRTMSIRMTDDLPRHWTDPNGPGGSQVDGYYGDYATFQIGIWAARQAVEDLEVKFSDYVWRPFGNETGDPGKPAVIPASALTCFNTGGIGWDGRAFQKKVSVDKGKVQALWCGIQIPPNARHGVYEGTVTVSPKGLPATVVALPLWVGMEPRLAGWSPYDNPYHMARLRWLDSTLAQDDDIVPPFTALAVDRLKVGCLGRSLSIGRDGFPALIRSYFAPEMTRLGTKPVDVTAGPIRLRVIDAAGVERPWTAAAAGPRLTQPGPGAVVWEADNANGDFVMHVEARMEFDGFVDYKVAVEARRDIDVNDIRLDVPLSEASAKYMMGLGFKGGLRPETFDWAWDQKKNQDALWLGTVHAGLQVGLRAENYSRPLNTNFYLSKPLNMPPSWWNGGKGTVTVRASGKPGAKDRAVVMTAGSGARRIKKGEVLRYDFTLLLTPFKPLDPAAHFAERYYHAFKPLDEIAATGANVINIHHANAINPYINYPFLRAAEMKAYIDDAHRRGFKVKIYDTVRELSNRAPELFALRSLGHEIFSPGPGGGYSWLQEHLGSDYIAAWFVPELKDAAVINSGMSRWHNYYIEGLDWVARNVGIDGLYLDDVAFDRTTMKRVRKVLDRNRPGALIDLHSANQYNVRDGFASSANLYLEHFPFLNRLWFGEYFDYNGSGPDYWLVEVSGLPFGLMGEMLQDGGNAWRGMVFGMTARLPWAGDPRPLWKVWDEFGISESEMIGWWVDGNPVKTGNGAVLATTFVRKTDRGAAGGHGAMIALASWAKEPVDVRLAIDWKKLGLDPKTSVLRAPAIDKFQDAAEFKPGDPIRVEPGKGWLLVLR